jgi:hypothetical protein
MLYLQSKSKYTAIIMLDPSTGAYQEATRDSSSNIKINGVYDFLDSVLVALYLHCGSLILRVGEQVIPLVSVVKISVDGKPSERKFSVAYGEGQSLYLKYSVAEMLKEDMTPFIENEDFDFGLFVSNVLSDPSRREVLQRAWKEDVVAS